MNKVCLVGRLTARPELRYTSTNVPFVQFTLAVNRNRKNEDGSTQADFISCRAWRSQAEIMSRYLDKGSLISLTGRIETGSYTGQDGQRKFTTDVVADNIQFLNYKKQDTTVEKSPYDYQKKGQSIDPFSDFGEQVSIDDDFLD